MSFLKRWDYWVVAILSFTISMLLINIIWLSTLILLLLTLAYAGLTDDDLIMRQD